MATLTLLVVSLFLLFSISPAQSAVFHIPSGNVTALIAAINAANANGEENTINLEAGNYVLTAPDNVGNGLPVIVGNIIIRGHGNSRTTIERDRALGFSPSFRILSIETTGILTLESLAVKRGQGTGPRRRDTQPGHRKHC
jgi:hypothetical protein